MSVNYNPDDGSFSPGDTPPPTTGDVQALILIALQGLITAFNQAVAAATSGTAIPPPTPYYVAPGPGMGGIVTAWGNLRDAMNTRIPNRANQARELALQLGWIDPVTVGAGAGSAGSPADWWSPVDLTTIGVGAGAG